MTRKKGPGQLAPVHCSKSVPVIGDPIVTKNGHLGIVKSIGKDEAGEYIIAVLDELPGDYAFDLADVQKLQDHSVKE